MLFPSLQRNLTTLTQPLPNPKPLIDNQAGRSDQGWLSRNNEYNVLALVKTDISAPFWLENTNTHPIRVIKDLH